MADRETLMGNLEKVAKEQYEQGRKNPRVYSLPTDT
jgi:hypothetical protein